MTLIICINDYWQHKVYYKITPSNENVNNNSINKINSLEIVGTIKNTKKCPNVKVPVEVKRRLSWNIDGINFYYLNQELLNYSEYRGVLSTQLNLKGVQLLWLQIVQPERDVIDWKW